MTVFTAIGAAIFGAGTFLAGLTSAGLQIAASIGINLIAKAVTGEPQKARFAVQGQIQGGDDVPRSINVGWNCTAGSKAYQNEWGAGGVLSTRVIALGDMAVRELVGVEVDGSPVTLGSAETGLAPNLWNTLFPDLVPSTTLGFPALEYRKGGKDHLWIRFYDGTQTAADPMLVNHVASEDRPYGANRIGRGVPYVVVTSLSPERVDGEEKPLFQGFPSFKFITNGVRLYDISRDSSAGGNGSQRWDNPATWGGDGDFLAPVQIYNLLRGIRWNGQWLYGLQDVSASRLPAANWIAAINKARAGIAGPNGTEPTYRAGGELQVGAPIYLAIEALLTACQGRLVEAGGIYKLYVGEPGAPVMQFADGDILSSEEQTFTPFYGLADTVNGIDAKYPNPNEGWNSKDAPKLRRPDLEAKDGNRRLLASVSLDMVPYIGQVQRLMKSALLEALRARRHTIVLGPEFRVLEPGDIVRWTSARNGYIDKLFRVDGILYKANLDVIADITEVDPSDYDWDPETDFRPVIDGPLNLVGPLPIPMTGWQVFPATIKDDQGRDRRPSIEVWYASGLPDVARVRVQVRLDGTQDVIFDGEVPYGDPWKTILAGQFSPATHYEVRGIFVRDSRARGEWSAWLDVTTLDIRLTSLDIEIDNLAAEIGGEVTKLNDWAIHNTRETIEQARRNLLLDTDQDAANYNDKQTLRRELTSVYQDSKAEWTESILAATGPNSALVLRIEELRAEVFDPDTGLPATAEAVNLLSAEVHDSDTGLAAIGNAILSLVSSVPGASAEGLLRIYTSATGTGEDVRIALSASTNGSAGPANSALYITAGGGNSQILLVAGRIAAITSPTGEKRGLLVVDGDNVYIDNARIRNLTAVNINVAALTASAGFFDNLVATTANIANGAITEAKIGTAAVTSAKIDTAAITSAKIGDLQVARIKIAGGAVTSVVDTSVGPVTIPSGGANPTRYSVPVTLSYNGGGVLSLIFIGFDYEVTGGQAAWLEWRSGTSGSWTRLQQLDNGTAAQDLSRNGSYIFVPPSVSGTLQFQILFGTNGWGSTINSCRLSVQYAAK